MQQVLQTFDSCHGDATYADVPAPDDVASLTMDGDAAYAPLALPNDDHYEDTFPHRDDDRAHYIDIDAVK